MATNGTIYTGYWTNWSRGKVVGATITLSPQGTAVLNAFIAILVSFTGTQLWGILAYVFHQLRYKTVYVDGLEHQQRAILRNSTTPGAAAWSFLLQWFAWRNPRRTLPMTLVAILYLLAVAALSIFVPALMHAGDVRLLIPTNCGYPDDDGSIRLGSSILTTAEAASLHSRSCYEATGGHACGSYPFIAPSFTRNATCPFEAQMCESKNNSVPLLMTSRLIDSREDLGINLNESLLLRNEVTCSILAQEGHVTYRDGVGLGRATTAAYYNYGQYGEDNFTWVYNNVSRMIEQPYRLDSAVAFKSSPTSWDPIPELNRTDADVALILFNSNSVLYETPIDDPMFSSHNQYRSSSLYLSDRYGIVIGCAYRYQLCKPDKQTCSDLRSLWDTFSNETDRQLGLSKTQRLVRARLGHASVWSNMHTLLNSRRGFGLRASENLFANAVASLPDDQYLTEMQSWYTIGLSALSMVTRSFVAENKGYKLRLSEFERTMCSTQQTFELGDTTSFSFLSLMIILGLCLIIIAVSYSLERLVNLWQARAGKQRIRPALWKLDGVLQLQRFLFESLDYGKWSDSSLVPTTSGQRFGEVDFRQYRDPRFAKHAEMPQHGLEDMGYDNKTSIRTETVSYSPVSST